MRKSLVKNICLALGCLLGLGGFAGAALTSTKEATQVSAAEYSNSDYFINPDRSARTDYENINSQNWMGFVPGDRTINTVNIPGTHDTGMKEIYAYEEGTIQINKKAKTQLLYINEQLDAGIRYLDLRLNNSYTKKPGERSWCHSVVDCTITHGKSSIGGTYFAKSRNGGHLWLSEIISDIRTFLTNNPTETIIVSYQAETIYETDIGFINNNAKIQFRRLFEQINPSTGKSFVYTEDGKFGKAYTHFPTIGECRGQILLCSDVSPNDEHGHFAGGFTDAFLGARKIGPEGSYKDSASERKKHVREFYENHVAYVYDRADQSDDKYYSVGTNATDPDIFGIPEPPLELAEEINDYFFKSYSQSPFLAGNRRLGWVTMDGATEVECWPIYMSNFTSAVKASMRTLHVVSGLDSNLYPDQYYTLQLGASITLPRNIYFYNQRNNNNYFDGYYVDGESYFADTTVKLEDNMNVTSKWNSNPRSSVEIIWQDCEDEDWLRKDLTSMKLEILPSERVFDITKEEDWFLSIHDEDITNVIPHWDKIDINDEHPYGIDKYKNYRYEVEEKPQGGLILRLIHTPPSTFWEEVNIIWEDGNNQLGLRPKEVDFTVFENGELILESTLKEEDKWKETVTEGIYAIDGIWCEHKVEVGEVENYEAVIDGYTIKMYVTFGLLTHTGSVVFIDNDDTLRPIFIQVGLYHFEEHIEDVEFAASLEDSSIYNWSFPVEACNLLETYHTEVGEIENYTVVHTSLSKHHYAVLTSLIDHSYVITKIDEIGVVEFTTESKEKIDLARGLYDSLSEEEKALVTNYETLTDAESVYAGMDALYQQALPVIKEIENMPETGSLEWVMNIQNIKDHYDALPDEVKPYVYNYSKLESEYNLGCAMDEVNLFGMVFLVREPNDPSDYEKSYTCAYTMERWDKLIERYNALSDLAKEVVLAPDFEYSDAMLVDLNALYERYDLIIRTYGTDRYPDFLHRFSGPVIGTQNAMRAFEFNMDTNSTVLAICILAGTVLSFSLLVILKRKKSRE